MPVQQFVLPYPNFQSGSIIDPTEHNSNNLAIQAKLNEIIAEINSLARISGLPIGYIAHDDYK